MKYASAEWINEHRVFPRIFVASYLWFYGYVLIQVFDWFVQYDFNNLPSDQIIGAAAVAGVVAFPGLILTTMSNTLKQILSSYWNGTPKSADQ